MPRVSVVIPLYNKVRHIQRAINSALVQTYQDFELIVIDDGSTDGGGDVVRQVKDSRIRLITQPNAGVSAARNQGVAEAKTDLVAFLDADDEWMPNHLATVMELRNTYPEAGMYATAYRFCKDGKTWRPAFVHCVADPQGGFLEDYFQAAFGPPPIWTSAVMIPKHVLAEVGHFPVGMKRGEDMNTWARIALRYRVAWSPVEGAVYHFSVDNRACSLTPVNLEPEAAFTVPIEDFLRSGLQPLTLSRHIEEYCVAQRFRYAILCCLDGKRSWALAHIARTRGSSVFHKKKMLLQCIVWLPAWFLKGIMRIKSVMRIKPNWLCQRGS